MKKCKNCKFVFDEYAKQLSYLCFEVEICPRCGISVKEGKFTEIS